MRKDKTKQKGFTLLIAVLATSIILSISLGVFDITIKEIKLSGLGRESQIAFYAADAGIECAFYWEIKKDAFEKGEEITCGGKPYKAKYSDSEYFSFSVGDYSCAKVKVKKATNNIDVIIESRGYNNIDCSSTSSFKVERAIKLTLKKS